MAKAHPTLLPISAKRARSFWARVNKNGPNGCWLWTGHRMQKGHGRLGRSLAHRLSWLLANSLIPGGMEVCHNCPGGDNPACVNPAHLFLASHREHVRDKIAKKQMASGDRNGTHTRPESHPRGERNYNARLTVKIVRSMRAAFAAGESVASLARRFGISRLTASSAVHRKTWAHVE